MKRLKNILSAAITLAQLPKADLTPRERGLAYRRRERRPMATAKVVRREGGFFRLSNGTLVGAVGR